MNALYDTVAILSMTSVRILKTFGAPLALTCSLFAVPAYAASGLPSVDFNGDGVPDRVELASRPGTTIVVRVSGSAPQTLHAPEDVTSVIAADIDGDGDLDLASLELHGDLIIWLNTDSDERFEPATKRQDTPGLTVSRTAVATPPDNRAGQPLASANTTGSSRLSHVARQMAIDLPPNPGLLLPSFIVRRSLDANRLGVSRGPPFTTA
jgi:hypothetical protein